MTFNNLIGWFLIGLLILAFLTMLYVLRPQSAGAWYNPCDCIQASPTPSPTEEPTPTPVPSVEVSPTPEVGINGGGDNLGCAVHDCSGNVSGNQVSVPVVVPKSPPHTGKG